MSGFSIEVNDRQVKAGLKALQSNLADLRPAMAGIGQTLVTATDLSFRGQKDPWGKAWTQLKAATLRARRKGKGKGGAKILRDTGRLANSINYRADKTSVRVGTNVVYAAIHQFGGTIDRAARTGTVYFRQNKSGTVGSKFVKKAHSNFAQDTHIGAHRITIPARPFLPIRNGSVDLPPDTLDDILDVVRLHLRSGK